MKNLFYFLFKRNIVFLGLLGIWLIVSCRPELESKPDFVLVIHGGAGSITAEGLSPEMDSVYRAVLEEALLAGSALLASGSSAEEAVVAAIIIMEDSPLFNAGRGAVYNENGQIQHDASIMNGYDHSAGAVGALQNIKNPILAARNVMIDGKHVFMAGEGARQFAIQSGLAAVDPQYFFTESRWKRYEHTRKAKQEKQNAEETKGTVGAVALDKMGNLAAGTSTGGMHYKRSGRLGDSPVIAAGTYADNESCAVSATGHGEFFIRYAVAYDLSARMRYAGHELQEAAEDLIMHKLVELGADGGVIAVDRVGNIAMPFNTSGMFRGYVIAGHEPVTKLYQGE